MPFPSVDTEAHTFCDFSKNVQFINKGPGINTESPDSEVHAPGRTLLSVTFVACCGPQNHAVRAAAPPL